MMLWRHQFHGVLNDAPSSEAPKAKHLLSCNSKVSFVRQVIRFRIVEQG